MRIVAIRIFAHINVQFPDRTPIRTFGLRSRQGIAEGVVLQFSLCVEAEGRRKVTVSFSLTDSLPDAHALLHGTGTLRSTDLQLRFTYKMCSGKRLLVRAKYTAYHLYQNRLKVLS